MKITYIGHSGFLLEWEHCYWLFDYYQGTIPEMDGKKRVFVFSSHSHVDHFNPAVFELSDKYEKVTYLFSGEIRRAYKKLARHAEKPLPEVQFLQSCSDTEWEDGAGEGMRIHTLISTDCGCAFYIEYCGCSVYHAGDLHWWTWPGESEQENREMAGRYKKEISWLEDKTVDVAFNPLDPRQEQDYSKGMDYLLNHVRVKHVFPMHFWEDYCIIERYQQEGQIPEYTQFCRIEGKGQSWEIL